LNADDERLAAIFRAMGHPIRVRLLREVVGGELCVSALGRRAGSAQATMSQHLAILRDRGLVVPERRGNMTCYRLADARIADLIREAREVFNLDIELEAADAKA
jgi:DNA-binding transcriptional ArsR family regulator